MANKCSKCSKLITRKSPGVRCNTCEKIVHATTICAGLTSKQLSALRATEHLEWTCEDCTFISPKRKSFIIPEDDPEEHEIEEQLAQHQYNPIDIKKLLHDITKEVEKTIRNEMKQVQRSVDYCSAKIDEYEEKMSVYQEKIKDLEKKNIHLTNKNENMELKLSVLEQRVNEMDQKQLRHHVEIADIPYQESENLKVITETLANKLGVEYKAQYVKRLSSRAGKPGVVVISLTDEQIKKQWLTSAQRRNITVVDLLPTITGDVAKQKIYVREALTQYTKRLLWKTKHDLQADFKYIWCKEGKILVRKEDNGKVQTIRSEDDIKKLLITPVTDGEIKATKQIQKKRGPYKKRNGIIKKIKKFKFRKLWCEPCGVKFTSKNQSDQHKKEKHKDEAWICEFCGKSFVQRASHYAHVKSHLPPQYTCDSCNYSTWHKHDLVKHIRIHTGIKLFQCQFCTASYYTSSNLSSHIKKFHERLKPFQCNICNRYFTDRTKLNRHIDSHNEVKRFECEVCHSRFTRRCYWKQHLHRQHSIVVPPQRPGRQKTNLVITADAVNAAANDFQV